MTIGSTSRTDAVGNGAVDTYPYTFKIFAATDLRVTVLDTDGVETVLTYPTHYTVDGVGAAAGGNIVLVGSGNSWQDAGGDLLTDYKIAIRRVVPYDQTTDIRNQGGYRPATLEDTFDRLVMQIQQLVDESGRTVRVSETSTDVDTQLPAPVAGSALAWASDGKSLVNIILETGTSLVDLAATTGSTLVGFIASIAGSTTRTVRDKLRDIFSATDRGAVADKSTDNTASILSAAIAASAAGINMILVPFGCKYDRTALLEDVTFPDDVVLFDLSGINDYTAAGESTKHYGIVSRDAATDDTAWAIDSGHHPFLLLNNFGSAGTASASARKVSALWAAGQYELGSTDKRGYRAVAIMQFSGNDYSTGFWTWHLRSLAPWAAVADQYELWAQGQSISGAGRYRVNGDYHYVSTGAGTTGSTPPTHSSGTVSDGGVSWTAVDSVDRSLIHIRNDGRIMVGSGSFAETLRIKVSGFDASGTFLADFIATGVSKSVNLKGTPTNGSGTEVVQPFLKWDTTNGFSVVKSDGSSALISVTDSAGLIISAQAGVGVTDASGDTTPDYAGKYIVYCNPAAPITITAIDGLGDWQQVVMYFGANAVTLTHSGTLRLTGSVNFVSTVGSSITLRKIPASISNAVWEESRSLK